MKVTIDLGDNNGLLRIVDSAGRIVIPSEYRKTYDIKQGTKFEMFLLSNGIFLKKV